SPTAGSSRRRGSSEREGPLPSANGPEARSAEDSPSEREGPLPSANGPEARSAEDIPMSMRVAFHGGFGEKGRTCLGIEVDDYRLLIDAGVKASTRERDRYPAIDEATLRSTDALILTHAHEDHVAALGWCIAHGFEGRILVTRESEREIAPCVAA